MIDDFETASWPDALPHPDAEFVFSIVCGNSHYRWCVLSKDPTDGTLSPTLFWKTAPVPANDMTEDSSRILLRYLPDQAKDYIFGVDSYTHTRDRALGFCNSRRMPIVHVYVISTNAAHEKGIAFLFRDIPSRVLRLGNTDFYTRQQGCYDTLGVDRAAAARAAAGLYGYPCLVIDGGTALTYTAVDVDGQLQGGGICQGLNLRLKSFAPYTDTLPAIKLESALAILEKRHNANEPFGLCARRIDDAILGTIMREMACLLRNIVDEWSAQAMETFSTIPSEQGNEGSRKYNKNLVVCVTGGDCQVIETLLQPNFGNIIAIGASTRYNSLKTKESSPLTKLNVNKQLLHQALPALIQEKAKTGQAKFEDVRRALIGQRVAVKFAKDGKFYRGTIASCQRDADFTRDVYTVFYEDEREDMDIEQVHAALLLYVKKGEELDSFDDSIRESQEEKRRGADKAAELLGQVKSTLRLEPTSPKQGITASAKTSSTLNAAVAVESTVHDTSIEATEVEAAEVEIVEVESDGRKRKRSIQPPSAERTIVKVTGKDGKDFIGCRVAKFFDVDLYFGTVSRFMPSEYVEEKVDVWAIEYDDGDKEDFDASELQEHLALYDVQQGKDPNQSL